MANVISALMEEDYWHCNTKDQWKHPTLTLEERTKLDALVGPILLNMVFLDALSVMVKRRILNPCYLYLDSCSVLFKFLLKIRSQTSRT